MEEIYMNVEYEKPVDPGPSTNPTGPRSSERRFHGAVVLCLGLLSVFLLAKLISLGVHYSTRGSDIDLSTIKANLTERLQASENKLSSVSAERDLLNASLTEKTKELDRLQSLSKEKGVCPAGWRGFSCACYLLSEESGSWENGREDCREREADLVVIGSSEEQMFLSNFTERETQAWIGLTDRVEERTWMWIDGAPLSLKYWLKTQPDNGGGHGTLGEEDCAHIITGGNNFNNWNDLSCNTRMRWICEKMV
ncbi:CD209 antigen-like protein C [Sebastes fasciatus]|uniref:CD209 antigen-like protein C n=1 Tax=Sebastes fasciatus TaxID=394691 RepID=UPI003D9E3754